MDARSARIHALHDLSRAAGCTIALQREIKYYREYVLEILSCDERHHHVAREKIDVLATSRIPPLVADIRALISDVRGVL